MRLCFLAAILFFATGATAPAGDCAHATTQSQMDACASQSLQAATSQLAAAYAQILTRLKSDPAKSKLFVAAETAWGRYRDADCAFASSASAGGSIYPSVLEGCLQRLTLARLKDLKAYASCSEYDASCPVPAR